MSLLDKALVRALPAVPRPLVRRFAERYIAGPKLADACRCVKALNGRGKVATLDVLGEEVSTREEALALVEAYRHVFDTIEQEGLDSNVSIKLTGLGLNIDHELCRENVATLMRCAGQYGNFVRIDMEDSSTTDETLAIYRELREQGLDNVGVVLQARLRRTLDDIAGLADLTPNVRLCKGIYLEPPEIAYQGDDTVRFNFVRALEQLLGGGSYVGIATHDEFLIGEGLRLVEEHGLAPDQYEHQMLLGVREELGAELVREGHRLRIYVPFGRRWYEYSMRRLQENPKIATYVALDSVSRLVGKR